MPVEILKFPNYPGLKATLRVSDSISPSADGTGSTHCRDYDLNIVDETTPGQRKRALFPIEGDVDGTVKAALENGESPTLAIFEENTAMLDDLRGADPRVHAAIVQHQINQTVPPSPLPPPARPSSI